jgi:DNA-binding FadR family transcriptional regulator
MLRDERLSGGGHKRHVLRLHGAIARDIGMAIVSGHYKPGAVLEGEVEASERRKVSRSAYREAVRILSAKGLVESRPKTGTRVSAREDWHLLDPDVLNWIFAGRPDGELLEALFELRQLVEPAATALAAGRRSETELAEMGRALDAMRRHTLQSEAGAHADHEFHAALLRAAGNCFVASLTKGIVAAVEATTIFKQRETGLPRDAIPDHVEVYEAVAAGDPQRARHAMESLIHQAYLDTPGPRR